MQNLINRKFQKKAYRHMLVSEIKKDFGYKRCNRN